MLDQEGRVPVTPVGGEIVGWSDLEPDPETSARPALAGPLADQLLAEFGGRTGDRVLVAGPHDLELITSTTTGPKPVHVLVRSVPDAERIAAELPSAEVFCGGLDRFGPEFGSPEYDLIVALDGVPRLFGPDSNDLAWPDAVAALRRRLAPGGLLLLGAANGVGLTRLISAAGPAGDDGWPRSVDHDVEPPAGLAAIDGTLAGAGLTVAARYAVFGDPAAPRLAARSDLLDQGGPVLQTLVADVLGRTGDELLTDPTTTARDVVGHGLGTALAPRWWFVLTGGGEPPALPGVLLAEPASGDEPALVQRLELDPDGGGWRRQVLSAPAAGPWRDPQLLADQPVPAGTLLADRLSDACRYDDQPELLRLVTAYVAWLRTTAEPVFATTDNVVVADGKEFAVLDPSWRYPGETTPEIAALRSIRRFVVRLLSTGVRTPWPAGATPDDLVTRLAAEAGLSHDAVALDQAARLDAEVTPSSDEGAVVPRGRREAEATIARLSQELADARGQVEWLDQTLSRIRSSRAYRVGRAVTGPASTLKSKLRRGKD
jgi:hypothetical protein